MRSWPSCRRPIFSIGDQMEAMPIAEEQMKPFIPAFGIKPGASPDEIKATAMADSPILPCRKLDSRRRYSYMATKTRLFRFNNPSCSTPCSSQIRSLTSWSSFPAEKHDLATMMGGLQAALKWFFQITLSG